MKGHSGIEIDYSPDCRGDGVGRREPDKIPELKRSMAFFSDDTFSLEHRAIAMPDHRGRLVIGEFHPGP
jgi:Zn-finger nucleic acid-binding protein